MGTFDTYNIAWGDSSEQLQTKQFDSLMRSWAIGERVPLSEAYDTDVLVFNPSARFATLIEDHHLAWGWAHPELLKRHFFLGHADGFFADYGCALSEQGASELAAMAQKAWGDPRTGSGLARRLAAIQDRNATAREAVLGARANVDPIYRKWRAHLAKKAALASGKSSSASDSSLLDIFDAYRGPDFSRISRRELSEALDEITSAWPNAMADFESPIDYPAPITRAQAAALECRSRAHAFFAPSGSLGAPGIDELLALSEPSDLNGPPTPERAMGLLRSGSWRLFEADARALAQDDVFVDEVQSTLALLCHSRLGSHWAAGFLARLPAFGFGPMQLGGESIELIDWMVVHMGLPSRLVEPLADAGFPAGEGLAHHCLHNHHRALLPMALARLGNARSVPPFAEASLAVHAARHGSLAALQALASEGALDPSDADSRQAAAEANAAESREDQRSTRPEDPSIDAPMGPALACAVFLHELGINSETPLSERLLATLAARERALLGRIVGSVPSPSKPPRI